MGLAETRKQHEPLYTEDNPMSTINSEEGFEHCINLLKEMSSDDSIGIINALEDHVKSLIAKIKQKEDYIKTLEEERIPLTTHLKKLEHFVESHKEEKNTFITTRDTYERENKRLMEAGKELSGENTRLDLKCGKLESCVESLVEAVRCLA